MSTIMKGTDTTVTLTVTSTSDGSAIDISTAATIECDLYQGENDIIQSFTLADGNLDVTDGAAGEFQVILDRENSEKMEAGQPLYAEVRIGFTNADYQGSKKVIGTNDVEVASNVLKSVTL